MFYVINVRDYGGDCVGTSYEESSRKEYKIGEFVMEDLEFGSSEENGYCISYVCRLFSHTHTHTNTKTTCL